MATQHPFLYGPIFEAISQYQNIYDYHRFAALCKQTQYYASEYRNLIPATKALQLLQRAMRKWSFLRIITRTYGDQIGNPIYNANIIGSTAAVDSSFICFQNNRVERKRRLPIVHSLRVEYKNTLENCKYVINNRSWNDYVCTIAWYFYDVEEQPTHCKLCYANDLLADENFNGVFKEPFPTVCVPWEDWYLQFPEYVAQSRVYLCIKVINTVNLDIRRYIKTEFWTTNNGIQYYQKGGFMYLNPTPVKYTPAYKEIPY